MQLQHVVRAVTVAGILATLTACAEDSVVAEPGTAGTAGTAGTDGASAVVLADLTIEYDDGSRGAPVTYGLVCGPDGAASAEHGDHGDGGDHGEHAEHPDPAAACAGLAAATDPFAEVPDDAVCTQIYGGPQTAVVTGRYRGDPVDTTFDLRDGCRIARWEAAGVFAGIHAPGDAGEDVAAPS